MYHGYFSEPCMCSDFCAKPERVTVTVHDVLDRTAAMFKYTAGFDIDWLSFERVVQTDGACALAVNPTGGGVVMLRGHFSGLENEQMKPTKWTFANAFLNWADTLEIGKDCIVVRNTVSASPFTGALSHFATMQAETELSLYMANIDTRTQNVFIAGTDSDKKSAEIFMQDLRDGRLSAVTGQNLLNGLRTSPYGGKTGIITDLIELLQYSRAGMWNHVGINANYNMKREALNSAEGQMSANVLSTGPDAWLAVRREDVKNAAAVLGYEIGVELAGQWARNEAAAEAAAENEDSENLQQNSNSEEGAENVSSDAT